MACLPAAGLGLAPYGPEEPPAVREVELWASGSSSYPWRTAGLPSQSHRPASIADGNNLPGSGHPPGMPPEPAHARRRATCPVASRAFGQVRRAVGVIWLAGLIIHRSWVRSPPAPTVRKPT